MKILLFGGTGRTGKMIIEEAGRRGIEIVTIAGDPAKLEGAGVEVVRGTPYDAQTVKKAIRGCDAVINTLNVSRKTDNPWAPLRAPEDLISKSALNAIAAMKKEGIKRFVALSAIGAGRSRKKIPLLLKAIISFSNMKYAFRDHGRQEEILESSEMEYTICRAPMLSEKPDETGAVSTPEGVRPASMVLSRQAAARFFLDIISNREHIRETISLANRPG